MKMAIRSRFKLLLAQKELDENRKITYAEIKDATGVAESTLSNLATNSVTMYSAATLSRLCDYFRCETGDLIQYIPDERVRA